MPRISNGGMISLDTEDTGLDLKHGAKPYLVTFCDEGGNNTWYEWDVNPVTRQPIVPAEDLVEIRNRFEEADSVVLQNPKFDWGALGTVFDSMDWWDWGKVYDTLLAGHLLASNQPHDLTSMSIVYLGVNAQPFEDALEVACLEARRIAKHKYPTWRIAKAGLPEMPSAKEKTWKYDAWLPRAVAKQECYPTGKCEVVNLRREKFDVRIDRTTKWGNPFHIGVDGSRSEVIDKYRRWITGNKKLMACLPELEGKRLGCFCKPQECHGDVLAGLLAELAHPWWTVCSDYANSDSAVTLPLFKKQRELIKKKGLWRIYQERLKLLPALCSMELRGVTISKQRTDELKKQYIKSSAECHRTCVKLSKGRIKTLPKAGASNDLKSVLFDGFQLETERRTKKGNISVDKYALDEWLATLPREGVPYKFIANLKAYRKRQTALGYIASYEKFWLPYADKLGYPLPAWRVLYPSLNPTGTDTLRFSSSNPNSQQISKQEIAEMGQEGGHNARYMFGPAPGREWWSFDYENLELRIPAYESGEKVMIDLFEKPDEPPYFGSYHLMNASIIYPDLFWPLAEEKGAFKKKYASTWYQWVKNFGFAFSYGCMQPTGDRAAHRAGAYDLVKDRLSEHSKLNKKMIDLANKQGYVETIPDKTVDPKHGYPIYCTRSRWGSVSPTIPLNYHTQSSAMWCTMKAMIRVHQYLLKQRDCHMVMQIHDEIVIDLPAKKNLGNQPIVNRVKQLMEMSGDDIGIPLKVAAEYHPVAWEGSNEG
ncbi:DNA polymerase [Candidatus Pacearchaeota archaeon]|jgi:DNA polymerase I-like protein with 3'-5' exonuclease and polymerase domains|nr:DNA polymerase [Candidatus Pacearchaeota archaeon]